MLYIYIPLIIVAVFVIYSLYVLLIEKNLKKNKAFNFSNDNFHHYLGDFLLLYLKSLAKHS